MCIRLCPIVACLRAVVSAVCQENASSVSMCYEVCAVSLATCTARQHGLVEEVRTKRDRGAGGGGLRAFPREERATTETCASA